jgi:hypothetical protein
MLISEKQQEANRQNAQHSTGPATPAGKAAVRLNALTYGLRARSTLIDGEDPEEYKRLWANLEAEWQPKTTTERLYLEQMSTSQWLFARIATGESRIYEANIRIEEQFPLLREVATQRTRLERSFTSALRELKQLQKERQARTQQQPVQAAKAAPAPVSKPAEPQAPRPDYKMSEGAEDHPVFCAPIAPDTR